VSETGTKDWKVLDVRAGKTEPNPHGGQFQKFYVDFEGSMDTYWRRSAGDEPEVGKTYYGTITEGNYGPMFKKEKKPDGHSGGSSERSTGGTSSGRDLDASIARQVALKILAPRLNAEGLDGEKLPSVEHEAERIERFILAAGQKASQGAGAGSTGGGSPTPSSGHATSAPPPGEALDFSGARKEEPNATQDLDDYRQLLWNAGLEPAAARDKCAEFMGVVPPADRLNKAISGLQDLDRQGSVLGQLKAETEEWIKGPLPKAQALDDDIPF